MDDGLGRRYEDEVLGCKRKMSSCVGDAGKDIVGGWSVANTCGSMYKLVITESSM